MELLVDIKKKLPGFALEVKFESGQEALGLLGASGAGKSMTLRCIAGLIKPDEGKIILNGRVLFDSEKGINIPSRKRKIGFLFQNYALFPNMTIEENIGFALESAERKEREKIIAEKIEMVKLEGLEKRYPHQLSGGQQQRVALARALAVEPEALLLDEPFSALDDYLRTHVAKQLVETLAHYRGPTLFVTHNMEDAYRVCNKLIVLMNGKVDAYGEKEQVFQKPPSFATAQVTGCKNFSAAKFLSQNELEAVDWGVRLKAEDVLTKELKYVGIRAHYIRPASGQEEENVFPCWPCVTSETQFGMSVYLTIGKEPLSTDKFHLHWEISKEKWYDMQKCPLPWQIHLSPERLMPFDR